MPGSCETSVPSLTEGARRRCRLALSSQTKHEESVLCRGVVTVTNA